MNNTIIAQTMGAIARTKKAAALSLLSGTLLLGQATVAAACSGTQIAPEKAGRQASFGSVSIENPVIGPDYYQSDDNPFHAD
jgi:hypothetical protein